MDEQQKLTQGLGTNPETQIPGYKFMTKKEFWIRFSIWVTISLILPLAFIMWKFDVFHAQAEGTTDRRITGWGVICVMIMGWFIIKLVEEVKAGFHKGSMARQCLDGIRWLIPLFILIFVLDNLKDNIADVETFLIVFVACEAVAIPINPVIRWAWERNIEIKMGSFGAVLRSAISGALKDSQKK
jgi:hypothetical protein